MAFSVIVESKQPGESKPYSIDFSEVIAEGEAIDSVVGVAYAWDDRDGVSQSYPLTGTREAAD